MFMIQALVYVFIGLQAPDAVTINLDETYVGTGDEGKGKCEAALNSPKFEEWRTTFTRRLTRDAGAPVAITATCVNDPRI